MYLGCSLSPALVSRAGGSHSMCPFTSMFLSLFLSPPPTLPEQKMEKCPRVRIIKKNNNKIKSSIKIFCLEWVACNTYIEVFRRVQKSSQSMHASVATTYSSSTKHQPLRYFLLGLLKFVNIYSSLFIFYCYGALHCVEYIMFCPFC
uniref:Uncharacterized protein n=1 Tax=Molossus molossus TaxID=27622 RepID=A0A7J8HCY9_MOLMO|nr:hypothetical protein HJG59_011140 [Molossus molossus]